MIPSKIRSSLFFRNRFLNESYFSNAPKNWPSISNSTDGQTVHLQGWIKAVRRMKNLLFLNVDSGKSSNHMQVVLPKELKLEDLSYGSSVKVRGELGRDPKGNVELRAENIEVIGKCDVEDSYPFVPRKVYSDDYVRKFLHMRIRTDSFAALLRIRDATSRAVNDFFHSDGFILVNTPIITSSDCEGAGEVFTVKPHSSKLISSMAKEGIPFEDSFFNKKVFLSVSGQLQLEAAVRNLVKVYTFGPVFRAENSKSRLHLSEFYMVEAEMGFVENLEEIIKVTERFIRSIAQTVLEECADDINCINKYRTRVNSEYPDRHNLIPSSPELVAKTFLSSSPYVIMSYDEAINILESKNEEFKKPPRHGESLTKEHELYLVRHADSKPVFIVDWPSHLKAFYMKQQDGHRCRVSAMDLLIPVVGEVCGGSLREDDYKKLETKLIELNLKEGIEWYLEIRKYGNVPTGGFGLGFERLLQSILSIPNIKDTIPFPRWPHNCHM